MQQQLEDITIALAGMLQSIALVRDVSQTGKADPKAFETCIYSIFQLEPKNILETYGGLTGVKLGLQKIIRTFDGAHEPDRHQHRYLLSLIHLQKRLSRSPKILDELTQRLEKTQKQVNYFHLTHSTVIANLADVYLSTISSFRFRIMLSGSKRVLLVRENMEKIRALLLAGVRSAVLWRQAGGSRLQLLFMRTKLKNAAEEILKKLTEHEEILQKETV